MRIDQLHRKLRLLLAAPALAATAATAQVPTAAPTASRDIKPLAITADKVRITPVEEVFAR